MASQVCTRCRKRRIRCDMQLPACKNCRLADVDCMIWDATLDREIRCSYIYTLQQRVQSLQLEIEQATDQGTISSIATGDEADPISSLADDYHLKFANPDYPTSSLLTVYLGPGSSAQFIKRLLTNAINWHISNNIEIPKSFVRNDPSYLNSFQEPRVKPSFLITIDQRRTELHTFVSPSTQRAIIEHYLKVVTPEYDLLPEEHVSALLTHENPLKWASSNKDDSVAFALGIVFAISTALITRDLDCNLSYVSMRSREDVHKYCHQQEVDQNSLKTTERKCTGLCALSICELISPTSGQIWDLLGRAASMMEDLQEYRQSSHADLATDFRRLDHVLLKLEGLATMHFKRPSLTFDTRLRVYLNSIPSSTVFSNELYIVSCLHSIMQALTSAPIPSEAFLESRVPLSLQVASPESEITIASATLYIKLHPLFTDPEKSDRSSALDMCSPRLIYIVAKSASVIIDHFTQLNESSSIIGIWLATEQVLEAGAVWTAYLIHLQRLSGLRPQGIPTTEMNIKLSPILKVSTLLASFGARWKAGSVYIKAWEALIELLWGML